MAGRVLKQEFAFYNFIGAISREHFTKVKVSHQFAIPKLPNSIKDESVEDIERFLFISSASTKIELLHQID